ncbi:MAG: B12-binding domain-containing radical SAM protein [Rickettsiales bacterium]|jgi:radical SAM superfamily enzyme YgiQ (UPF0313 family)|nr:B12-binding domain-containing radical SAM protein [Rickettsiales bacterium]
MVYFIKNNNFIILTTPSPKTHRTAEENLGLGYLAAILRNNGYNVKIIDGWLSGMTPFALAENLLQEQTPLFIGFSAYQSNIAQAIETLSIIKKSKNIPCIVGGFGPTFAPEQFLQNGFDFVIRGEAEESILDLANYFNIESDLSKISGLSYIQNDKIINNPITPITIQLNDLPYPARDTMHMAMQRRTPVHLSTARGCSGSCAFCSIASFFRLSKTCKWRGEDISRIISELKYLENMGVKHIKIIDDSFIDGTRNENWCKEFAEQIRANNINIHFRGSIRADKVSPDIIKNLKESGFFSFSCGIENFATTALKRMSKSASVKQNNYALNIFRDNDIYVQAGQILFDPYTTMSELWENYHYMQHYDWIISKGIFTEMFAASGTPFQNKISKQNASVSKNTNLGNYSYKIQDKQAQQVYNALKLWHTSNMRLYDKAIDPLTSPKALTPDEMKLFYNEYMKIHHKDLEVMRSILDIVEYAGNNTEVMQCVSDALENSKIMFGQIESNIDNAYKKCGIIYDACVNPFIKVGQR